MGVAAFFYTAECKSLEPWWMVFVLGFKTLTTRAFQSIDP